VSISIVSNFQKVKSQADPQFLRRAGIDFHVRQQGKSFCLRLGENETTTSRRGEKKEESNGEIQQTSEKEEMMP